MKSKITLNTNTTVLLAACMVGLAGALAVVSPWTHAQDVARTAKAEPPDDKRWQAVAPGRVEAWSGEIKITSPVAGLIGDVLVKAHDKVLAGDPLVRLQDSEIQARLAAAEAQIGLRKRVRNEQNPTARANDRRKAEDAVADAEKAIVDARAALDRAGGAQAPAGAPMSTLKRRAPRCRVRRIACDSRRPSCAGSRTTPYPPAHPGRGTTQHRARRAVGGRSGHGKNDGPSADCRLGAPGQCQSR